MAYADNGRASALPLLGVFIGGIIVMLGLPALTGERLPEEFLLKTAAAAGALTLPLALYAGLYARYLIRARDRQARLPVYLSVLIYCLLAVATLLGFPLVIYAAVVVSLELSVVGAMFLAPFAAGLVYGGFLSVIFGGLWQGKWPHRFLAHVLGGGTTGLLIFFLYVPFGAGVALKVGKDSDVAGLVFTLWSAVLLTLCYVPHAFATRPWQAGSTRA